MSSDSDSDIEIDLNYDVQLGLYKTDPDYLIIKNHMDNNRNSLCNFVYEDDDYTILSTNKYQRSNFKKFIFPSRVKELRLCSNYNICLCSINLPDQLEKLVLDGSYNQPLDCIKFPLMLKSLTLGDSYSQPLDEVIFPPGLKTIRFNNSISKYFVGINLPEGLEEIIFGHYNFPYIHYIKFPDNLKKITFDVGHCYKKDDDFLINLSKITFPKNLEEIEFLGSFNESLDTINFPPNLKKLSLGKFFTQHLNNLPTNLEILSCEELKTNLKNLPVGLKKLIIIKNSIDDKYSKFNNFLKDMVKIPYDCVLVGSTGKILDFETTMV